MKSAALISLLLIVFLVESVRCGMMDEMCPKTPCPEGKVCVAAGILRLCEKPAGEGHRCVQKSNKYPDGSYKGAPPCQPGLKCPDTPTPLCEK